MTELENKISLINSDVASMQSRAKDIQIKSDDDMVSATNFMVELKAKMKRIEELRVHFTKPSYDAYKNINDTFMDQLKPLKDVEKSIKIAMKNYFDSQIEQAKDVMEETNKPVPMPETNIKVENGRATIVRKWDFYVDDFKKIPDEYLMVDEKKIRSALASGERDIPGIKIFKDTSISIY